MGYAPGHRPFADLFGIFGGGQGGQGFDFSRLFDSDMLMPIGMALLGAGGARRWAGNHGGTDG